LEDCSAILGLDKSVRPYPKNKLKQKAWGAWFKNTTQNDIEIPSHHGQNGYHQETRTIAGKDAKEKELSFTVSENIN
jgi:hypothetical protein